MNLEQNPVVSRVRGLCDAGKADVAVVFAFERVFSDTVRHYGLDIPPGCTALEFVTERMRADMGTLRELLPELYRLYEPVRFGGLAPADGQAVRGLVERIYTETSLAWAYDPHSQSKGPAHRTFSVGAPTSLEARPELPRRS